MLLDYTLLQLYCYLLSDYKVISKLHVSNDRPLNIAGKVMRFVVTVGSEGKRVSPEQNFGMVLDLRGVSVESGVF